jgi:LacI family transcriptional regulator
MISTISDIAKRTGSSVTTISRVLNGQASRYRISEKTEKRVLKAAKDLNYKPNQLARGLRLKKSQSIGLVLPDISNPFFAYMTRTIQTFVHEFGYGLVTCNTNEDLGLEIEHINVLLSKRVDGLIIMPVGQKDDHLRSLVQNAVPVVLVDRCFDDFPGSSVVVDNYRGAFEAVQHLVEFGHRKIAIIQGLINTFSNTGRLKGYQDALERNGISFDASLIVGSGFGKSEGYIETKRLLKRKDRPTAIFATSDLLTLGVLQAVQEEGLAIPEDISLVSFDDTDFAPYLRCPLTAVAQPKENIGEFAAKLLFEQMKTHGKKPPERIVLKPTLIRRESVKDIRRSVALTG